MMRHQIRRDDPNLDLADHARDVVRGKATLTEESRRLMVAEIGTAPDPRASDRVIARQYLAHLETRRTP